ncbi:hypothetical protein ACEQ38_06355 [Ralstonia syzygii subsp. celebesensis]|uniref:hypothetical protein n=1 Tax=Ralstonia syzygii TaxID=28097 RepID=UPI001E4F5437|nr:hypothetical protein [Ralstonia syzygii]
MLDVGQGEGVIAGAGLGELRAGGGIRAGSIEHDPVHGIPAPVAVRSDGILRADLWSGLRLRVRLADHQPAVLMQQR